MKLTDNGDEDEARKVREKSGVWYHGNQNKSTLRQEGQQCYMLLLGQERKGLKVFPRFKIGSTRLNSSHTLASRMPSSA